jgi:hypothetical protein
VDWVFRDSRVGYVYPSVTVIVASDGYCRDEKPDQLALRGGVVLHVFYTASEREEVAFCGAAGFPLVLLRAEVSLDVLHPRL